MAVIGKIREKSGLVMIIIGIGMIGFLFQDGAQSLLGSGPDNSLGEIGGVEVTAQEFDQRLQLAVSQWESQNEASASADVRASFKDQVWDEFIRENVLESQFIELGLAVSSDELFDMVRGNDPHPQVKQSFTDPATGSFNPAKVLQFLKSLESMPVENKKQWLLFEKGIEKERIANKYNLLLSKGLTATSSMAKRAYTDQKEQRDVKFVVKRYNTVDDSTVSVTDADLKAYYNEHKGEYKQGATRELEYVKFDVTPSKEDIIEAKKWIDETAAEFKLTEDDSSFVVYNSEAPLNQKYYGVNEMPFGIDSAFFYQETGSLTDVYEQKGSFMVTKLSSAKMIPDSVKARHILLKTTQTFSDTLLEAKLDSIKTVLKNGGDFAEIAKNMSEDVGSAIEGGDLGWFKEGVMVPTFNAACFDGKPGDMVIVQSQFGFHLIEVLKQADKTKKVQLATVTRKNVPSNETFDAVFAEASMFYTNNGSTETFTTATESDEYTKFIASEVKVSDKNISGMTDVRELVRWSFNNEKGFVSAPMQFSNTFIVAHLSEVREEGTATMDQVEIQVELGAKKKKKAAMFMDEMNGSASLDALATQIGGAVESASGVSFSALSISGMGQEMRVNGMLSTLQNGQMSIPIEGQSGVYVVQVATVTSAPETTDYSIYKAQLTQQYTAASGQLLEALKDKMVVVDERYKFY